MNSVEIKIFGQTFLINPPDGKREYYLDIASRLDRMMVEEGRKSDIRSDVKVAVKIAFLLAAENMGLRAEKDKGLEILERIDSHIDSFGV